MGNYGMIAMVTFNEPKGKTTDFHNCTEVHFNYDGKGSLAIESDIHGTGGTWLSGTVFEVEVKLDDKIHNEHVGLTYTMKDD